MWTPDSLLVQLGDPGYSGPDAPRPEVLQEWDPHVEFEVIYDGPRGPETMDRGETAVSEISFDEENVLRCSRGSVITFSSRSYHSGAPGRSARLLGRRFRKGLFPIPQGSQGRAEPAPVAMLTPVSPCP